MSVKEVLTLRFTEIFPRVFVLLVFEISLEDVFILNNLKCIKGCHARLNNPYAYIVYDNLP